MILYQTAKYTRNDLLHCFNRVLYKHVLLGSFFQQHYVSSYIYLKQVNTCSNNPLIEWGRQGTVSLPTTPPLSKQQILRASLSRNIINALAVANSFDKTFYHFIIHTISKYSLTPEYAFVLFHGYALYGRTHPSLEISLIEALEIRLLESHIILKDMISVPCDIDLQTVLKFPYKYVPSNFLSYLSPLLLFKLVQLIVKANISQSYRRTLRRQKSLRTWNTAHPVNMQRFEATRQRSSFIRFPSLSTNATSRSLYLGHHILEHIGLIMAENIPNAIPNDLKYYAAIIHSTRLLGRPIFCLHLEEMICKRLLEYKTNNTNITSCLMDMLHHVQNYSCPSIASIWKLIFCPFIWDFNEHEMTNELYNLPSEGIFVQNSPLRLRCKLIIGALSSPYFQVSRKVYNSLTRPLKITLFEWTSRVRQYPTIQTSSKKDRCIDTNYSVSKRNTGQQQQQQKDLLFPLSLHDIALLLQALNIAGINDKSFVILLTGVAQLEIKKQYHHFISGKSSSFIPNPDTNQGQLLERALNFAMTTLGGKLDDLLIMLHILAVHNVKQPYLSNLVLDYMNELNYHRRFSKKNRVTTSQKKILINSLKIVSNPQNLKSHNITAIESDIYEHEPNWNVSLEGYLCMF